MVLLIFIYCTGHGLLLLSLGSPYHMTGIHQDTIKYTHTISFYEFTSLESILSPSRYTLQFAFRGHLKTNRRRLPDLANCRIHVMLSKLSFILNIDHLGCLGRVVNVESSLHYLACLMVKKQAHKLQLSRPCYP